MYSYLLSGSWGSSLCSVVVLSVLQQELLGQVGAVLSLSSPAPSWLILLGFHQLCSCDDLPAETARPRCWCVARVLGLGCPHCCGALWNWLLFSQPGCAV